MQADLEKSLAEIVKSWVSNSIKQNQPRFCCDIDKILRRDLVGLVYSVIRLWEAELMLLSGKIDGKERSIITSFPLDQTTISMMLKNEGTLSVSDLTRVGGCTFDVSDIEESDDTCSLLAAAWGAHENCVSEIKNIRIDAEIFRGN